jgi:hypothetical protein
MDLSIEDVANTALLLRDTVAGAILILEGPEDARLLDRFLPSVGIVIGHGKGTVIGAIRRLDSLQMPGFLGIVDNDFQALQGPADWGPNVAAWDYHDMEITVLASPALDAVSRHMCSPPKVTTFVHRMGADSLFEAALVAAKPLGVIRWLSASKELGLSFESIKLERFVQATTLAVNARGVVAACLQAKDESQRGLDALMAEVEAQLQQDLDLRHLCRGHDVMFLLARGLRRALATHGAAAPGVDAFKGSVLAAYSYDQFRETTLHSAMRDWERLNPNYAFLR